MNKSPKDAPATDTTLNRRSFLKGTAAAAGAVVAATAASMAHGFAKASGQSLGMVMRGTVGLQHAAMAVYNAWGDRVPMMLLAGNGLRSDTCRPGVEWNHSVQDPGVPVRDFIKWDDLPISLRSFAESTVRAYKYAMTAPQKPVMITLDIDFAKLAQGMGVWAEGPITDPARLGPALARAIKVVKSGAPVLVDAVCQGR